MSKFAIKIQKNFTYELYLKYPDSAAYDLTGWQIYFQAWNKAGGDTQLFSYRETDPEISIGSFAVDGETYNLKIEIDDADTEALPTARGVAQIKGIDPGGDDYEILPQTNLAIVEGVV